MLCWADPVTTHDGDFLPYAANIDIVEYCRGNGLAVRSHPFFRDMAKRWPFVLCELKNATVLGETFTPVCGNVLLSDCLSYFGIKQLRKLSHRDGNSDRRVFNVEKAFLLGGDQTFGHFISAYIMRALYLQLFEDLRDIPVITMAGMPKNIYHLLSIFGCPPPRLIMLEENDAIECRELYVPTIVGGVPPEGDVWTIPAKLSVIYRDLVVSASGGASPEPPTRAIYLLRGDTKTKLVRNDVDVIAFMRARGYEIVDPGTMSVSEQVRLGQQTRYFVTSTGSQIHLADFAKPGAEIILLSCEDHVHQRAFSAIDRWDDLGVPVTAMVCESDADANLTVDLDKLERILKAKGFPA